MTDEMRGYDTCAELSVMSGSLEPSTSAAPSGQPTLPEPAVQKGRREPIKWC